MMVSEEQLSGRDVPTDPRTRRKSPTKRLWRRLRRRGKRMLRWHVTTEVGAWLIYRLLLLIRATQRMVEGSSDHETVLARHHPAIVGMWHGQHLLAPFFRPNSLAYAALLSRSRDAEINAAIVERFGIAPIRGSGGRVRQAAARKGGTKALLALRKVLTGGTGVAMIADIPKGTPRDAGLGIVTLARISGRPIIPAAATTSRRYVVQQSWDKTTVPLPFGRMAVVLGDPIFVPADADDALMEAKRQQVTEAIEAAARRADALVGGRA
ncbi:lysophospholipid acyltransferase family protein [Consotaella aegiceratis]|uniref:lysophospholipid acyltransferase family protein n=1 Tax=Consotaella aegiceratis TaxID=3097961 RepID=UPI002F41E42A